jgi:branched-chain amino acid transport system ATP-binding protein
MRAGDGLGPAECGRVRDANAIRRPQARSSGWSVKTLAGDLPSMSGSIEFEGRRIDGLSMARRARAGIGDLPQENAAFSGLTVRENLQLTAIRQADKSGIDEVLTVFPKLGNRLGQAAGTLSGGVIEEIAEQLQKLAKTMSVVLVEQHIELAMRVAHTAYMMGRGRIALQGPVCEVKDDPELRRYLAP